MAHCPEYERLCQEVERTLADLAQVTTLQLAAFRADNRSEFRHLDHQLELNMGRKERAIGALRQHVKDHNCIS